MFDSKLVALYREVYEVWPCWGKYVTGVCFGELKVLCSLPSLFLIWGLRCELLAVPVKMLGVWCLVLGAWCLLQGFHFMIVMDSYTTGTISPK